MEGGRLFLAEATASHPVSSAVPPLETALVALEASGANPLSQGEETAEAVNLCSSCSREGVPCSFHDFHGFTLWKSHFGPQSFN